MEAVCEDMQFIISSKGKRQLVFDGYFYNKQKTLAGGVILWECVKRRNERSCTARVKTNDGRIIRCVNEHNCIMEPDKLYAFGQTCVKELKLLKNCRERPRNIIIDGVYGQDNAVLARPPAPASMACTIRRQRQRVDINKPIPDQYDVLFNNIKQPESCSYSTIFRLMISGC